MGFLRKITNKILGFNIFKIFYYIFFISKSLNGIQKLKSLKYIKVLIKTQKIEKNFNLKTKLELKNYLSAYNFIFEDWFTRNIPTWLHIFNKLNLYGKEINYLEIGCYEGRSSIFILELLKKANCKFVDPYNDYASTPNKKPIDMKKVFKSFTEKCSIFKERVKIFKISSDDFFKSNKDKYDLIFIDGSHYAPDVTKDILNAYKFLKKGGIMILDDLFWNYYQEAILNPIGAIIPFIISKDNEIKILTMSEQVILQKK